MYLCQHPEGCLQYCEGTTDYCATHNRLERKKITDEEKENNKREKARRMAEERARRYAEKASQRRKAEENKRMAEQAEGKLHSGRVQRNDEAANRGKKQSYIKPRSSKRAAEEREYLKRRDKYLTLHPECERCSLPANQIHHRAGRDGKLLINVMYFMAVCPDCHCWIHDNPNKAKEEGYSVNRLTAE